MSGTSGYNFNHLWTVMTCLFSKQFLRIKREKVGDEMKVNRTTSADTDDVSVAMETAVAEDIQIATDTPSVNDKQVVKDTVVEDVTSSVVPNTSDGDTSTTPVVPPGGGMLHVLGTEDVLSVMNPEAVSSWVVIWRVWQFVVREDTESQVYVGKY